MNPSSASSSEFADEIGPLVDLVLGRSATLADRDRLEQLVQRSEEARWFYLAYVHDTLLIHRWCQEQSLEKQKPGQASATASDDTAQSESQGHSLELLTSLNTWTEASSTHPDHKPEQAKHHAGMNPIGKSLRPFLCLVAGLLFVLIAWKLYNQEVSLAKSDGTQNFARVVHTSGCVWRLNGKVEVLKEGDWLHVGRYELESGLAKLLFPWGTEATLEAPADFEFTREGNKFLWNGQLVAKVSPEDSGFTIDTPSVRLIDLGTEFGLSTNSRGESEVHVFKGLVEVRPRFAEEQSAQRSFTLRTGQATGFESKESPVRQIAFNPQRFSKAWRANNRIAKTTGAMRFTYPAPNSVVEGSTEASDTLVLISERQCTLDQPLAVTVTEPGLYTTFNDRSAWIPAGSSVESYLVHFDPVGSHNKQAPVTVEGSVTFDRPIVAVIARGDQLAQSDSWFALPGTVYLPTPDFNRHASQSFSANIYPGYAVRGMTGLWNVAYSHESPAPNDWFRLSADRKMLTVRCSAGGESDQLRVLVSADETVTSYPIPATTRRPSQPFHGRPFKIGETIEAEDFDLGGQEVAYYDTTADSLSNVYRGNESVELKQYIFEDSSHTCVSLIRAGEWLAYTVDISEPGTYVISARAGSQLVGGKFRFEIGKPGSEPVVTSSLKVPTTSLITGALEDWYGTVTSEPVQLQAGQQVMRIVMEANHTSGRLGNLDWIRIDPAPEDNKAQHRIGSDRSRPN